MTAQLSIEFEKKRAGKARAAGKHAEELEAFRAIAERLGRQFVNVTIDNIREQAETDGEPYSPGAWMGSVFAGDKWEFTGNWRPSTHKGAHGRPVRVWRLRG